MITWVLAYLLVGFALEWVSVHIWETEGRFGWKSELMMTLSWPVLVIVAAVIAIKDAR